MSRRFVFAATLIALPFAALAHHGWGSFDPAKVLDHTGTIARSVYANPHGTLYMMKDGAEMTIELAPVSRMDARGLTPDDITAGKSLRVYAYQNVNNARLYRAEWLEVNGKRIELR
jgi:Family of unknown function (DUF6152)